MKINNLLLCAAILVAACSREMRLPTDPIADPATTQHLVTQSQSEDHHVQSATGHVDQTESPFGVAVIDQYSFSAIRTPQGKVNGQFEFRAKYGNVEVRAHGSVECLTIDGNKARIAGIVRQSSFEEGIPSGSELTWTVTDNGEPGAGHDTASEFLGAPAQAFCAAAVVSYPEAPIRRGNIQVRP